MGLLSLPWTRNKVGPLDMIPRIQIRPIPQAVKHLSGKGLRSAFTLRMATASDRAVSLGVDTR